MTYKAPLADINSALEASALADILQLPAFENADAEVATSILEQAAKLAENVIAPLNRAGDTKPAKIVNGLLLLISIFPKFLKIYARNPNSDLIK